MPSRSTSPRSQGRRGASTAHFSRSFKQAFGETPHRYLLQRRMERAKELLRSTALSVTEVSFEVGFQSLGSFSTAFRQLVGEPPSDYARRWRAAKPPIPACFTLMSARRSATRSPAFGATLRDNSGNWFSMTQRSET